MAAVFGDIRKTCMGAYEKKVFERVYLSQETLSLTHRYSFSVIK